MPKEMHGNRRLIDANALKIAFKCREMADIDLYGGCHIAECFQGYEANEIVDKMPTVDAVEVVHGKWEKANENMPIYRCSICKERNLFKNGNNVLSNFCPNCGADMKDNKLNLEDVFDLEAQTKANNDAMRKAISFMVGGAKVDGDGNG